MEVSWRYIGADEEKWTGEIQWGGGLIGHAQAGFAQLEAPALEEVHLVLQSGELVQNPRGTSLPNGVGCLNLSFALVPEFVQLTQSAFDVGAESEVFGAQERFCEGAASSGLLVAKSDHLPQDGCNREKAIWQIEGNTRVLSGLELFWCFFFQKGAESTDGVFENLMRLIEGLKGRLRFRITGGIGVFLRSEFMKSALERGTLNPRARGKGQGFKGVRHERDLFQKWRLAYITFEVCVLIV
jgi:hypothetical protein